MDAQLLEQLPDFDSSVSTSFKKRVERHFSKAAVTYDAAALMQRRIGSKTMTLLPTIVSPSYILDLGSGTGQTTKELAQFFPEALVMGMDIAQGMTNYASLMCKCETNHRWMVGDIEYLPFQSESFDMIYSNLAVQWCDLHRVLCEVKRVLKSGGCFIFSSLAQNSLWELKAAWHLADNGSHTNSFLSFKEQKKYIDAQSMQAHTLRLQTEKQFYSNIFTLLQELRALGVNTVSSPSKGLMTRKKLQVLAEAYETYREQKGLPLSYQVVYGHLQKIQ